MMAIKIQCGCGQKYAFEIELVAIPKMESGDVAEQ